ncbi:MAG: hypothetical protein IK061_10470 [Desulfovibrio sp.]|nr:hypothetical protein [Desulfovibrio sp.]
MGSLAEKFGLPAKAALLLYVLETQLALDDIACSRQEGENFAPKRAWLNAWHEAKEARLAQAGIESFPLDEEHVEGLYGAMDGAAEHARRLVLCEASLFRPYYRLPDIDEKSAEALRGAPLHGEAQLPRLAKAAVRLGLDPELPWALRREEAFAWRKLPSEFSALPLPLRLVVRCLKLFRWIAGIERKTGLLPWNVPAEPAGADMLLLPGLDFGAFAQDLHWAVDFAGGALVAAEGAERACLVIGQTDCRTVLSEASRLYAACKLVFPADPAWPEWSKELRDAIAERSERLMGLLGAEPSQAQREYARQNPEAARRAERRIQIHARMAADFLDNLEELIQDMPKRL